MNTYKSFILQLSFCLLMGLCMLTACSGDNQEAPIVSADLLVIGKSIEVSGGASQDTVRVEANGEWSVTTQTSWIHIISPRTGRGSGSQDLIFDVDASTLATSQTGQLTLNTADGIQRIITVTQRAGDIIIDPIPTDKEFQYDGGEFTLTVKSNVTWTAKSSENWLTINNTREVTFNGNQDLNIRAERNTGSGAQTGTITFNDEDNRKTVIVMVKVHSMEPSLDSWLNTNDSVPAIGGERTIYVRSNYDWIVRIEDAPWIYFDGELNFFQGTSNSTALGVHMNIEPNTTDRPKSATLTIKMISNSTQNTLTINQSAGTRPEIQNVAYQDTTHTSATVSFRYSTSTFPVTECGVRYSTSESGVRDGAKVTGSSENGMSTVKLTGLMPNTRYYVCAYATNVVGTTFSNEVIHFMTRRVPGQDDNEIPDLED